MKGVGGNYQPLPALEWDFRDGESTGSHLASSGTLGTFPESSVHPGYQWNMRRWLLWTGDGVR